MASGSGQKIIPLGQGDLDLEVLRTIRDSGYRGRIGILGHTQDDAEDRLQDNLDGLDWLVPQLDGKPAGAAPIPRTAAAPANLQPAESRTGGKKNEPQTRKEHSRVCGFPSSYSVGNSAAICRKISPSEA